MFVRSRICIFLLALGFLHSTVDAAGNTDIVVQKDIYREILGILKLNPDFAIETQHRDDKEGCRFGRKKCAHTLEYVSAFF